MRRGLVLGCGGTLGFAWSAVALALVEERLGWDARDADVIVGTSAGAELAAFLGAGVPAAELRAAVKGHPTDPRVMAHLLQHPGKLPPVPSLGLPSLGLAATTLTRRGDVLTGAAGLLPRGSGDAGWLHRLGDSLADERGWVPHPAVWLMATDVRNGRRVAFGSPDAPTALLGEALAASWAIPGWFPPERVGTRRYADGGVASPTSADFLVGHVDEVVVIAPMSTAGGAPARGWSRLERVMRSAMTRRVDREVALLEAAGVRVARVEPGPAELDAMGPNFMDLGRRPATVRVAEAELSRRLDDDLRHGMEAVR